MILELQRFLRFLRDMCHGNMQQEGPAKTTLSAKDNTHEVQAEHPLRGFQVVPGSSK